MVLTAFIHLFSFIAVANVPVSCPSQPEEKHIAFEQLKINQDGIMAGTKYSFAHSPTGSHASSVKDYNSRLKAYQANYTLLVKEQYTQLLYFSYTISIRFCKSILLYPFHYFW